MSGKSCGETQPGKEELELLQSQMSAQPSTFPADLKKQACKPGLPGERTKPSANWSTFQEWPERQREGKGLRVTGLEKLRLRVWGQAMMLSSNKQMKGYTGMVAEFYNSCGFLLLCDARRGGRQRS